MKALIWIIAWFCVAVWTAVMAFGYWIIDLITDFAANNADMVSGDAEAVAFINWLMLLIQSLGEITAVILWFVVSAAILGLAWFFTRLSRDKPAATSHSSE